MNPEVVVGHVQRIQLTPEVRMGINIMTMTAIELHERIENLLLENPFLTTNEEDRNRNEDGSFPENSGIDGSNRGSIDGAMIDAGRPMDAEHDDGWPFPEDSLSETTTDSGADYLESLAAPAESLEAAMHHQLMMELRDPRDQRIAATLLRYIDEQGYLRADTDLIASDLEVSPDRVEYVLSIMQSCCMPAGIGARSLQERLTAQLRSRGIADATVFSIVENHLVDLAEGRIRSIADSLGIERSEVRNALRLIRTLDPHPFESRHDTMPALIPEVHVVRAENAWCSRFDETLLPAIAIDSGYYETMRSGIVDKRTIEEIDKLMSEAAGIVRAVDLRKMAIMSISAFVTESQQRFFESGIAALRPLTMADAAAATGISESTVSRVANSVHMSTPQGVLPMRSLFNHGIRNAAGEDVSSLAIKNELRKLIENEDPSHPLSDNQLSDMLQGKGMSVSRRTVNKYRTTMGILSRTKRRA